MRVAAAMVLAAIFPLAGLAADKPEPGAKPAASAPAPKAKAAPATRAPLPVGAMSGAPERTLGAARPTCVYKPVMTDEEINNCR